MPGYLISEFRALIISTSERMSKETQLPAYRGRVRSTQSKDSKWYVFMGMLLQVHCRISMNRSELMIWRQLKLEDAFESGSR